METLKHSEMRIIDDALDMGGGYVLDFSDRTFAEFFDDEFGVDIYSVKYGFNGRSKAKHMRAFIKAEDEYTVARVLRRFWEYRESIPIYAEAENRESIKRRFFGLLAKIEGAAATPRTDAIDRFARDETLEELVDSIERDISANKPAAALDRLHTYCMKKFGHLLDSHGVTWDRKEPLHSRAGKYVKALEARYPLRDASRQIIKSAIGIFEKFNHIRNDDSLAHDNDLPDHAEARFIFDSIAAILRFIKSIEATRFGS
jgi:Abortive infection C-terminus